MEKDVETFYDNVSNGYEDHDDRVCDKLVEHFMLANLPKGQKIRILDAGGGIGRFSKPLLESGHEVVLSELSKGMLEQAKKSLGSFDNVTFVKESVTAMDTQEDASFDVVIMMNAILDYCGDHTKAIKEVLRVLKKGGIFLGSVNNRFIYCRNHELLEGDFELYEKNMKTGDRYIVWGGQSKGHISHEFTLEELKQSLSEFNDVKILGIFNLLDKYEMEKVQNKEEFIKLQIRYAEIPEYTNNSSDFFFIAQKE